MTFENNDMIILGILLILFIPYFWKVKVITDFLQQHHHEQWVRLGEFKIIRNNYPANGFKIMTFFITRKHIALNDPTLNKHVNQWSILLAICLILMITLFIVVI